jgi:hypothetical protein
MEIINRKSKAILMSTSRSKGRVYMTIKDKKVYFTVAVARMCELNENLFVHFINDENDWRFFVNDDADGFKMSFQKDRGGYFISNVGLVNMILSSYGFKNAKRFSVEQTDLFQDKCPIYKITLDNVSTVDR